MMLAQPHADEAKKGDLKKKQTLKKKNTKK
jgi:hypothetical protein